MEKLRGWQWIIERVVFFYIYRINSVHTEKQSKPNLDCNYHSPIDLEPIGIPIENISIIEKGNYNPNFVWINKTPRRKKRDNFFCLNYHIGTIILFQFESNQKC